MNVLLRMKGHKPVSAFRHLRSALRENNVLRALFKEVRTVAEALAGYLTDKKRPFRHKRQNLTLRYKSNSLRPVPADRERNLLFKKPLPAPGVKQEQIGFPAYRRKRIVADINGIIPAALRHGADDRTAGAFHRIPSRLGKVIIVDKRPYRPRPAVVKHPVYQPGRVKFVPPVQLRRDPHPFIAEILHPVHQPLAVGSLPEQLFSRCRHVVVYLKRAEILGRIVFRVIPPLGKPVGSVKPAVRHIFLQRRRE